MDCAVRACEYAGRRRAAASPLTPASICRMSQSLGLQVGRNNRPTCEWVLHCPLQLPPAAVSLQGSTVLLCEGGAALP